MSARTASPGAGRRRADVAAGSSGAAHRAGGGQAGEGPVSSERATLEAGPGSAPGHEEHEETERGEKEAYPASRAGALLSPPRWAPVTSAVICALALIDSAYLTYTHYSATPITFCSTSGFVNCDAVTESSYSHPFGIPVAVAGLAWSVVMLALCSPWGWRAATPWARRARLAGSVAGVGMVFYLLWAELVKLHHLCEYCTAVHVLTIGLFFVVIFGTALATPEGGEGLGYQEAPAKG
ncbi:MAG: vitamin K epoxide reductase family protein [Acidimicrobiales bacterium]